MRKSFINEKNVAIEFIRIFSAILVVIHHFLQQIQYNTCDFFLKNIIESLGFIGVSLFFIISGYVIYLNSVDNNKSPFVFFMRRFFRLTPLYYLAIVIIYFLGKYFDYASNLIKDEVGILDVILHLLYIHNFFGNDYFFGINSVFWSLGIELQFYFIFYFILNRFRSINYKILLVYSLMLSLIFYWYSSKYLPINLRISGQASFITLFWVWFLGIMIVLYSRKMIFIIRKAQIGFFLFIFLFCLCISIYAFDPCFCRLHLRIYIVPFLLAFLVISLLSVKFSATVIIDELGRMSYVIYLFHPFVLLILSYFIKLNAIIQFAIYISGTLVLSYFLYKYVDRYFIIRRGKFIR